MRPWIALLVVLVSGCGARAVETTPVATPSAALAGAVASPANGGLRVWIDAPIAAPVCLVTEQHVMLDGTPHIIRGSVADGCSRPEVQIAWENGGTEPIVIDAIQLRDAERTGLATDYTLDDEYTIVEPGVRRVLPTPASSGDYRVVVRWHVADHESEVSEVRFTVPEATTEVHRY